MTQAYNLSQFANKVNSSGLADMATAVTGTLLSANGGTGLNSSGTNGNVLTSNGTTWVSSAIGNAATVTNGVYTTSFTGSNQSLTSNGWQKLPGGLIMQWGVSTSTTSTTTITFPIAFPTSALNVQTSTVSSSSDTGGLDLSTAPRFNSVTTTGFVASSSTSSNGFYWFAIGY